MLLEKAGAYRDAKVLLMNQARVHEDVQRFQLLRGSDADARRKQNGRNNGKRTQQARGDPCEWMGACGNASHRILLGRTSRVSSATRDIA